MKQKEIVQESKKRKERKDKNRKKISLRDRDALRWIGEQYAIRLDHLQIILAEMESLNRPRPVNNPLGYHGAMRVVRRWRDRGWVEYGRILADEPGWIWLTTEGLREFGMKYSYLEPKPSQVEHYHGVNKVRLLMEKNLSDSQWVSERWIRADLGASAKHYVDAEVYYNDKQYAIEVELTPKNRRDLAKIMRFLDEHYQAVWYFVSDEAARTIEKAVVKHRMQQKCDIRLLPEVEKWLS